MLCKYFPDTCVVAETEGKIVGFVSAFCPPDKPDVIFVWQVAVDESQRGKGLGTALLKELLRRTACAKVHYLETTITPSNIPSRSLFTGLARDLDVNCDVSECFSEDLFPGEKHEAELMYRIGPF
ncbi:MAG: L-2,4-diaminobutyric acid acetyltransferase [Clostridia bacterium]|nr:L-2,4-diaminobutyric acid acetyltransferase [Clostridia bacterium]